MPASNQTSHLSLNQWVGTDKPKMEDFNSDNRKIDSKIGGHMEDSVSHITDNERKKWNGAVPIMGTYTGNGSTGRVISLGFQPSFGMVFAIEKLLVQAVGGTGNMYAYSALIAKGGCSQGVYTDPDGFYVVNSMQSSNGCIAKMNENGVDYAYFVYI